MPSKSIETPKTTRSEPVGIIIILGVTNAQKKCIIYIIIMILLVSIIVTIMDFSMWYFSKSEPTREQRIRTKHSQNNIETNSCAHIHNPLYQKFVAV